MSIRFAPSPTGRFHLGNLRTAWISHAWAQALNQPWCIRFEDIDKPRVLIGANEKQLADMAELGLVPDIVTLQSSFHKRHWELFRQAIAAGQVYPCDCSRKEVQEALAQIASAPHTREAIYNGHCRHNIYTNNSKHPSLAWRFRGEDPSGAQDFIVARTNSNLQLISEVDFVPSYHWACAIDDWDGEYSLIVRAWDLESATPIQRAIQKWLALIENRPVKFPAVYHTALVTGPHGARLEKRSQGVTLPELVAQGYTPKILTQKFHVIIDITEFQRGRVWGEKERTISIKRLL